MRSLPKPTIRFFGIVGVLLSTLLTMVACRQGAALRCMEKLPADQVRDVRVSGLGQLIQDTFNKGDAFRVTATGTIDFGGDPASIPFGLWRRGTWGPQGNVDDRAPDDWPLPGAPKYSLIGGFNQSQSYFLLGTMGKCQVARSEPSPSIPGYLKLGTNDKWSQQQTGAWSVKVFEYHGEKDV
jgi:hypothetical protein